MPTICKAITCKINANLEAPLVAIVKIAFID